MWDKYSFGDIFKQKSSLLQKIKELKKEENSDLPVNNLAFLRDKKVEVSNKYAKEHTYWYQRAKCKWLHEGDLNTTFFHSSANMRRQSNSISALHDGDRVIEGDKEVLDFTNSFYKNLFSTKAKLRWPVEGNTWPPNPLPVIEKLAQLENDFFIEKIKRVVWELGLTRHRFLIFFYRKL